MIQRSLASKLKTGAATLLLASTMASPAYISTNDTDFEIGYALVVTYYGTHDPPMTSGGVIGGGAVGAYAGGKYGATIGSLGGPVGTVLGGIAGVL